MAAQRGLDMIVEVDTNGSGSYSTVAGLRTVSFTLDGQNIDITSQDDTSRFRQILASAGVMSLSVRGSGVFKDATSDATMRTYWAAKTLRNFRCTVPSFYYFICSMAVTNIEYSGEYNGEVTYSITLESAGDITFTSV